MLCPTQLWAGIETSESCECSGDDMMAPDVCVRADRVLGPDSRPPGSWGKAASTISAPKSPTAQAYKAR